MIFAVRASLCKIQGVFSNTKKSSNKHKNTSTTSLAQYSTQNTQKRGTQTEMPLENSHKLVASLNKQFHWLPGIISSLTRCLWLFWVLVFLFIKCPFLGSPFFTCLNSTCAKQDFPKVKCFFFVADPLHWWLWVFCCLLDSVWHFFLGGRSGSLANVSGWFWSRKR